MENLRKKLKELFKEIQLLIGYFEYESKDNFYFEVKDIVEKYEIIKKQKFLSEL